MQNSANLLGRWMKDISTSWRPYDESIWAESSEKLPNYGSWQLAGSNLFTQTQLLLSQKVASHNQGLIIIAYLHDSHI